MIRAAIQLLSGPVVLLGLLLSAGSIDATTSWYGRSSVSLPTIGGTHYQSSRSSRRVIQQQRTTRRSCSESDNDIYAVTATGLFGRKKKGSKSSEAEITDKPEPTEPEKYNADDAFADLGPIGKSIARVAMVTTSAVMEYLSGFMTGLVAGTFVGLPGFMFNPVERGVNQAFMKEMGGRLSRMNGRSFRWAKNFGEISAVFGASQVSVRLMRHGKEDAWTSIFSSALAGAFFARKGK
jgi:hypothetical protein